MSFCSYADTEHDDFPDIVSKRHKGQRFAYSAQIDPNADDQKDGWLLRVSSACFL